MTVNPNKLYLMLDSLNHPLARAVLESPPELPTMQLQVLEDAAEEVAAHEVIQLFGVGSSQLPLQCRILRRRGDRVVLEKIMTLDPEVRRNLRVPVKFESFLYPLTGSWKGRRAVQSIDLSCGGVAFYGEEGLEVGEQAEIAVPTVEEPLILRCQILRRQELRGNRFLYASKFVDMCEDEEVLVRETVFGIQLDNRPA